MSVASQAPARAVATDNTRWVQLVCCIICMVMIANLQYGWTLFVNPINKAHGWSIASIQVAFAIFIALETWLTPVEGWIVDMLGPRHGAKLVVAFGGITVGIGWVINAYATSLNMLYLGAVISGIGGGAVYATCVGMAVKWFPDRRGLAVGLTAAGYGAGSALTVIPIRYVIDSYGYESAFLWFGIIQGGVAFLMAWVLRGPEPGEMSSAPAPKVAQSLRSYTPAEVLTTPVFWLLYVMFVTVSASGLMATAQIAPIAKDFNVGDTILLWGGIHADGRADRRQHLQRRRASAVRMGFRPDRARIHDGDRVRVGRGGLLAAGFARHARPGPSCSSAALIFLTWGEIFSLFPSTCTDTFGAKFATVNLSLLYTAKGTSAFLVPLANVIKTSTGSWHAVFAVTAIMNLVVVALALFVLKPMRRKAMERT